MQGGRSRAVAGILVSPRGGAKGARNGSFLHYLLLGDDFGFRTEGEAPAT